MTLHPTPSSLPSISIASAPERFLFRLFDVATRGLDPMRLMRDALGPRPEGRVIVIGAGRASARMAEAVEHVWGACEGVVVTEHAFARSCRGVNVIETVPLTDNRPIEQLQAALSDVTADDHVLALISGGAEELLCAAQPPLDLTNLQAIWASARAAGASKRQKIELLQSLSTLLSGGLGQLAGSANLRTLLISDMPDGAADMVGGAPTQPTAPLSGDFLQSVRGGLMRLGIVAPPMVQHAMKPPRENTNQGPAKTDLLGDGCMALDIAARQAKAEGVQADVLGTAFDDDATELAAAHARIALGRQAIMGPGDTPRVLLSGGASSATSSDPNRTGTPNADYVLAAALHLQEAPGIFVLATASCGMDAVPSAAGAYASPDLIARAAGQNLARILASNQSHNLFERIGGILPADPTGADFGDFRAILILPPDA